MNPNGIQCSINCPFNNNAVHYPGFTLPRSFTLADHGKVSYGVFLLLSIILSPSQFFTLTCHEKQVYGVLSNPSNNHSHDPILDHFSLASVGGNSRALVLSITGRNQTRIPFVFVRVYVLFWISLQCIKSGSSLKVPYTVIRAHSSMGGTFAMPSDYLKDFYSFCLRGTSRFQHHQMGEFTSRTAQLKSRKENNKEACCAD